jgi:hypothetical protein
MTFVHGKDIDFQLDDASGTIRAVKGGLNSIQGLPGARGLTEVTAFGDQGQRYAPSLENGTFSIAGMFDSAATVGTATVLNGLRSATATASFIYGPEGSASGKVKYTGECWVTQLTVDASNSEKVPISASFQIDGVVTVGTY